MAAHRKFHGPSFLMDFYKPSLGVKWCNMMPNKLQKCVEILGPLTVGYGVVVDWGGGMSARCCDGSLSSCYMGPHNAVRCHALMLIIFAHSINYGKSRKVINFSTVSSWSLRRRRHGRYQMVIRDRIVLLESPRPTARLHGSPGGRSWSDLINLFPGQL